jgi:hypothetical protein
MPETVREEHQIMTRGPSPAEIVAFLAEVKAARATNTTLTDLPDRKADLFERIADARPGDQDAADIATNARTAADRSKGR